MKKIISALLLVLAVSQMTEAQTSNAAGWVKDENGAPLRYVFIADKQYKNAAFSDSTGYFTLAVHPDSKLQFYLQDYADILVNPDKVGPNMQIMLHSLGAGSKGTGTLSTSPAAIATNASREAFPIGDGGTLAPGHQKENLHGSQYLFSVFVHGYLVNTAGDIVFSPDYQFDYDKLSGALLLSADKKTITEVNWDQVQSFTLYNNAGERFDFEKMPAINISHYVQVLASGKKYKIYKLIKTKFVKADFVNNGVTSHGNDYDEYVDDADYYVVDLQTNQPQKLVLKKKSIKENFAKEADKANKFLSDNSGSIDDAYLNKLGAYMNQ